MIINQDNCCLHEQKTSYNDQTNCKSCGILLDEKVKAFKSQNFTYQPNFSVQKIYQLMHKQRIPKFNFIKDSDYARCRTTLIEYIWDLGTKLHSSLNTIHLSIHYLDFIMNNAIIPNFSFQLYAATAVMLASKAIELDERIPFISKLKKYSQLVNRQEDFQKAEIVYLKYLNFNLQSSTLIDILEFYLSQGVIFSSDTFENSNIQESQTAKTLQEKNSNSLQQDDIDKLTQGMQKLNLDKQKSQIRLIVQKIERDYQRLANFIIRDSSFIQHDMKLLAAISIAFLRKQAGLSQKWNEQLQKISGVSQEQINKNYDQFEQRVGFIFQKPGIRFNNNPPITTTTTSTTTTTKQIKQYNDENSTIYRFVKNDSVYQYQPKVSAYQYTS